MLPRLVSHPFNRLSTQPKNTRPKSAKNAPLNGDKRQPWTAPLETGAFVREIKHHKRWGKLIRTGPQPNRWLIQYSTGARMTALDAEIEPFNPTDADKATIDKATAFFERAMERGR
jgi:hypothetical protein